jgi:hypothetical protein
MSRKGNKTRRRATAEEGRRDALPYAGGRRDALPYAADKTQWCRNCKAFVEITVGGIFAKTCVRCGGHDVKYCGENPVDHAAVTAACERMRQAAEETP